jgi:GntP family gluconate:H+ symporter
MPFYTDSLFILLIGIIIVVGGILALKLHPFLALLLGAFVVAFMTPGSAIEQYALMNGATPEAARKMAHNNIGEMIAVAFGATCEKLGILVAMAAIIGKCLLESGGAEKIIRFMLKITGVKNSPIAFLISSFFIGIPVFFDAVIFLMMPLAKAMAIRINKNYLLFVLVILAGAVMANSLVPPAPGPLYLAGALHIPLGLMIVSGILLGILTVTAGYFFARWTNNRMVVPVRDSLDARIADIKANAAKDDSQLPPLWLAVLPIIIPILFICANTFVNTMTTPDTRGLTAARGSILVQTIHFLGDKNIALIAGGISAMVLLAFGKKKGSARESISKFIHSALMSGGVIILIIAAGGAFGAMLKQTGISTRIADMTEGYQMALIPLAFLIAAIIRTAQGSATVALITVSGVLAGMVEAGGLQYNPLYLGLAIGCGSKIMPWMNDSGFWVVTKMSNLTEKEALKTFTPMSIVMGCTGLVLILMAAQFIPLV